MNGSESIAIRVYRNNLSIETDAASNQGPTVCDLSSSFRYVKIESPNFRTRMGQELMCHNILGKYDALLMFSDFRTGFYAP